MLGILEKFEKVEIKNESRVGAEDLEFCRKQEKSYRVAIAALLDVKERFQKVIDECGGEIPLFVNQTVSSVYISDSVELDFVNKRMVALKEMFIGRVCRHFSDKYNVSINSNKIQTKYDTTITHKDIIDEIFIQLDGLDFGEKAIKELKDRVRSALYGKVELKNKKIIISSVVYLDRWNPNELSYSCRDRFRTLFLGLSHFEFGITETASIFGNVEGIWIREKGERVFKKHELQLDKVVSVKPFKNGKVEICFSTREFARGFAAEYLNHG